MSCKKDHSSVQELMKELPIDQGGWGRHKCAACAYEQGYKDGQSHKERIDFQELLKNLDESQAQGQRHKSPQAAYVKGYYDGIIKSYHK